ncbi:MAG: hypothetical protein P8170_07620 [Gemmatimonadota bacterium]|jgi:hypothetical protein
MTIMYCALCERRVEAKRRIGPGTWICGFLTAGISALAIPFYRKRCPICMSTAVSRIEPGDVLRPRPQRAELEQRLDAAVEELDTTTAERDRIRAERDFHRKLNDPQQRESE